MANTKIEWTDRTWNCIRGCSRISAGCQSCFAERLAIRMSGPGRPYEGLVHSTTGGPRWTGKVVLDHRKLVEPLSWRKPCRVFVNSMSDVFHEALADEQIDQVFAVMLACHILCNRADHVFQVLTKRAKRMVAYFAVGPVALLERWSRAGDGLITLDDPDTLFSEVVYSAGFKVDRNGVVLDQEPWSGLADLWPLPGVWLGVSVENQDTAEERIPALLATPAAVRWLSCEPLIGPVDLSTYYLRHSDGRYAFPYLEEKDRTKWIDLLDWVVVGGESGPGARAMHLQWVRDLLGQCRVAEVPAFVKQLGARPVDGADGGRLALADPKGGDVLEWPFPLQVREFPAARQVVTA